MADLSREGDEGGDEKKLVSEPLAPPARSAGWTSMGKVVVFVKVVFAVTALIGLSIIVLSHYRARGSIGPWTFDIAPAETPRPPPP
jgi:hypothetical protein